jgi:glycosyltransferase involved in cell wall biosynthesis
MKFLAYSEITAASIAESLGLPEYSYYFVLKDFLPVLRQLGEVQIVETPQEVDGIYDAACAIGQPCLFLSFSPPHKTPLGLRCPTIPIFAWEFDSIPSEPWLDEPHQDWRHVLRSCERGITHSGFTVKAVHTALGEEFPITGIPSPVWDKYQALRDTPEVLPLKEAVKLCIQEGVVLDTHDVALEPYMPDVDAVAKAVAAARGNPAPKPHHPSPAARESRAQITRRYLGTWFHEVLRPLLPKRRVSKSPEVELVLGDDNRRLEPRSQVEPASLPKAGLRPPSTEWALGECQLELSGVIFTALFNPYDGRKNWVDMLTAFCSAFRDCADATLVFKLGHHEYQSALNDMLMCMARMPKFLCRVVLVQGFLEKAEFEGLIRATAFVVNASHGEGQCLPLMEFLSCGKPAIAPRHSAMLDYIDPDVAFVVDSWEDATAWSHDPRLAYRTLRHQIDWSSLVRAYRAAYHCAKNTPDRYSRMSSAAIARMQKHCSQASARERLMDFLGMQPA